MEMHFKVRSTFRNSAQTTLTLDRVEWWRENGVMVTDEVDGSTYSDIEECAPDADGAYPELPGGKTTELRFDGNHSAEVGDFLTVTVDQTVTNWEPPAG